MLMILIRGEVPPLKMQLQRWVHLCKGHLEQIFYEIFIENGDKLTMALKMLLQRSSRSDFQ